MSTGAAVHLAKTMPLVKPLCEDLNINLEMTIFWGVKALILPFFLAAAYVGSAYVASCFAQTANNEAPRRPHLPPGVKMLKDLEYGHAGSTAMRLDLYLPEKRDTPLPLLIWVHGGAWRSGSKDNPGPALQFASEGYAVAQVGYRLSGQAIFPAQIYDCKAAVRWLRANSQQYGLDPNRFAAWGSSAGGHLVALLGTSGGVKELEGDVNQLQTSSRVQAVVDWFGPTDFLQITNESHNSEFNAADSPVTELLGGTVAEKTQLAAQASPITFVTKDAPPFLIMHGDQDQTVPIKQSLRFYNALKKAGVDATFIPVKGAGHGSLGPGAIGPVREFLRRTLGTGPASPNSSSLNSPAPPKLTAIRN